MKLRVLLIALLLLTPLTPSISATPPKSGAICSKAGVTKNFNGKKYTCIKSGKKLVWNKGVVVKTAESTKKPQSLKIELRGYGTYFGKLTQGDDFRDEFIKVESNDANLEVRVEVLNAKGVLVIAGISKLRSRSGNVSEWTFDFPGATKLLVGKYNRIFFGLSQLGERKDFWTSEFEVIPFKPKPSFKFGLESTCGGSLKPCPTINLDSTFLPAAACKIADATYPDDYSDGYVSSGFPPPKFSLAGKKNVKLLVIPVNFADRKISDKLYSQAQVAVAKGEGFYSFNSFGRVNFDFELLEKNSWVDLPMDYGFYEQQWSSGAIDVTQFLLDQVKDYKASNPDAITWLFPEGKYKIVQRPFSERTKEFRFGNSVLPAARVYGLHENLESIGINGFDHGVGHALYSFEDLYIFAGYSLSGKAEQPGNGWDVMIGGGDFFAWSKWIAGWLKDEEVYCLRNTQDLQTIYLRSIHDLVGRKLLAIPLGNYEILLGEYRTNATNATLAKFGLCENDAVRPCSNYPNSGLLLYKLDTKINHGAAPFRVAQLFEDELLKAGQSMEYQGFNFMVEASDSNGIYVQVSKKN